MIPIAALPTLNAILNATSALCLVAGVIAVRRAQVSRHIACMIAATAASALFLVSYLTYHAHVGSVRFAGQGALRAAYLAILISHAVLAVVVVPLVLRMIQLAVARRLPEHRRLARVTVPVWLYVSVTGVVVYWMLYRLPLG
jgi:putative membrane protein